MQFSLKNKELIQKEQGEGISLVYSGNNQLLTQLQLQLSKLFFS